MHIIFHGMVPNVVMITICLSPMFVFFSVLDMANFCLQILDKNIPIKGKQNLNIRCKPSRQTQFLALAF